MQIAAVKTGLRNLVLLAHEYRDRIPHEIDEEIKELKGQLKFGASDENSFTSERLRDLKKERKCVGDDIFKQLIYFIEKTLLEFATKKSKTRSIKVKTSKVDKIRKQLSKVELDLLSRAYGLHTSLQNQKWYLEGDYKPQKVRGFKDEIFTVIDKAFKLGLEAANRRLHALCESS